MSATPADLDSPTKNTKRAVRLHHIARLKKARRFHWGSDEDLWEGHNHKLLGKAVSAPCNCSCWMCGNPRKYFKEVTIQEKKFLQESTNQG